MSCAWKCNVIEQHYFWRIYVCFHALGTGFLAGCRKSVGLDGTSFKGPHSGVILTAIDIDANNWTFLVPYAICDGENVRTWSWFVKCLVDDLKIFDEEHWCIILNRQKVCLVYCNFFEKNNFIYFVLTWYLINFHMTETNQSGWRASTKSGTYILCLLST